MSFLKILGFHSPFKENIQLTRPGAWIFGFFSGLVFYAFYSTFPFWGEYFFELNKILLIYILVVIYLGSNRIFSDIATKTKQSHKEEKE